MRTIVHLSDTHFWHVDAAIAAAAIDHVHAASPDLIAISGDLTQRGWIKQFDQAVAFLRKLKEPKLVVPGNHDGAYFDPIRRFVRPLKRYRKFIHDDLMPVFQDDEMLVVGVNSVRAWVMEFGAFWKNGRVRGEDLEELEQRMTGAKAALVRIAVVHHPLANPWDDTPRSCLAGREKVTAAFRGCGVDAVLSGHLHRAYSRLAPAIDGNNRPLLCINAGTAVSKRLRDEPNSFNVLRLDATTLTVEVHAWNGKQFAQVRTNTFPRTQNLAPSHLT